MAKLDGHYLATKIVNHVIADFKKSTKRGISRLLGSTVDFIEPAFFDEQVIWPLERIRDEILKCSSFAELESAMDMFVQLYQRFLNFREKGRRSLRGGYDSCLDAFDSCIREINAYLLKQYFPKQRKKVSVTIKVRKALILPVRYAPIKIYHGSDCIQYSFAARDGELVLSLPKGKKTTFLAFKGKKKSTRTISLNNNIKIRI